MIDCEGWTSAMNSLDRPADTRRDDDAAKVAWIERSVLLLLFLGLVVGAGAVLKPFTTAILFGASMATATWPLRERLVRRGLGRGKTATLMLLLSIALIVVPILLVAPSLSEQL